MSENDKIRRKLWADACSEKLRSDFMLLGWEMEPLPPNQFRWVKRDPADTPDKYADAVLAIYDSRFPPGGDGT